jgi:DnaJ-class molecular chaperone
MSSEFYGRLFVLIMVLVVVGSAVGIALTSTEPDAKPEWMNSKSVCEWTTCIYCEGTGVEWTYLFGDGRWFFGWHYCSHCRGRGNAPRIVPARVAALKTPE